MTTATRPGSGLGTSAIALCGAADKPRAAGQILAETRTVVDPAHRAAVDDLPPETRHVAGYHIGWWEADGRLTGASGKAVRPAFVLACARAAHRGGGGDQAETPDRRPPAQAAVDAAVAVELVHDFSLLHDDVMDRDLTRRHRAAAWTVFGVGRAILAGDALTSGGQAAGHLAQLYQREDAFDEAAVAHGAELVEMAGGRAWALAEAERRIQAAREALAGARPEPNAEADLHVLADLITRRNH